MIVTNCPDCERVHVFDWRIGMKPGFFPTKCKACGCIMWVLGTSDETEVYRHVEFLENKVFIEDREKIERAASCANVCSVTDRE